MRRYFDYCIKLNLKLLNLDVEKNHLPRSNEISFASPVEKVS